MENVQQNSNNEEINYDRIDRLKKFLRFSRLKQRELAEKLGINERQVSHWVSGYRTITERTVMNICTAYPQLSEQWLLNGTGNMLKSGVAALEEEQDSDLRVEIGRLHEKLDEALRLLYALTEKPSEN